MTQKKTCPNADSSAPNITNKKPLLDFAGTEPWFKPKQFWKYWAAFYPVTWHGWFITLSLSFSLVIILVLIIMRTDSLTLIAARFAPFLLIGLVVYDSLSLSRGQYPQWWKKGRAKQLRKMLSLK